MSKPRFKIKPLLFFITLLLILFFIFGLFFLDLQQFFTGNKFRHQVQSGEVIEYSLEIHDPRSFYKNFRYELEKDIGYSFLYICIPNDYQASGYISVLVGSEKIPINSRRYHFYGGDLKRYQNIDLFERVDFGKADRVKSIHNYLVEYSMSSEIFYVDDTRTYDISVIFSEFNVDLCKSSALLMIEGAVAIEWPWKKMSIGEKFLYAIFAFSGIYVIISFVIYILYQGVLGVLKRLFGHK